MRQMFRPQPQPAPKADPTPGTKRAMIADLRPSHGDPSKAKPRIQHRGVPTLSDLMDVRAVSADVYELTEKEIRQTRLRAYSLNKDNHFGWRWRTLVEKGRGRYHQLLIWRIV